MTRQSIRSFELAKIRESVWQRVRSLQKWKLKLHWFFWPQGGSSWNMETVVISLLSGCVQLASLLFSQPADVTNSIPKKSCAAFHLIILCPIFTLGLINSQQEQDWICCYMHVKQLVTNFVFLPVGAVQTELKENFNILYMEIKFFKVLCSPPPSVVMWSAPLDLSP